MGMFDYVVKVPEVPCVKCGEPLFKGWQSKDGPCRMIEIHWSRVGNFYTYCDNCKHFNFFERGYNPAEDDLRTPLDGIRLSDYHTQTGELITDLIK